MIQFVHAAAFAESGPESNQCFRSLRQRERAHRCPAAVSVYRLWLKRKSQVSGYFCLLLRNARSRGTVYDFPRLRGQIFGITLPGMDIHPDLTKVDR